MAGVSGKGSLKKIEGMLSESCSRHCEHELKDEGICKKFCNFVPHIVSEHGDRLVRNWHDEEIHNRKSLEWAMIDVVQHRRRAALEDNHKIGEMFIDRWFFWHKKNHGYDEM